MSRSREEIVAEKRALLRGNRFIRDDFHHNVDRMVEKARKALPDQLASFARYHSDEVPTRRTEPGAALLDLAALWALTHPNFVQMIHDGINEAPAPDSEHDWSPLTRAELDKRVAALDKELAAAEHQDRRAPLLEQRAALDAELQALEG